MAKLVLLLCIAFLAASFVVAQEAPPACRPGGFIVSSVLQTFFSVLFLLFQDMIICFE